MIYPLFIESPIQLAVIFAVVLIIFGPGRLPDVFKSLGEGVRQFKDAADSTRSKAAALPNPSESQQP